MTSTSIVDDGSCPLLALEREIKKHRGRETRNSENETIVPAIFDEYRSNLVAPDHLLTGLAKNILSLIIELTPTGMRSHIDIKICDELKRNGLLLKRTILKSNGKGLASMSLSGVFCTLAVAVPVFRIKCQSSERIGSDLASAFVLAQKFLTLINQTYWCPQLHIDGHFAVRRREEGNGEFYFADLRRRAVDYIQSANDLCTVSKIVARHLDKPNLYRLLELYTHTLPAFGHVNHFMELVFETAHQPLKRCIVRGNHRDDHLSAVEHSLGNDWQARLMLLQREVENSDQSVRQSVMRGIRRLLLGKGREEDEGMDDEELDGSLLDVFKDPVIHMLRLQSGPMNLRSKETGIWLGRGKSFKCKGEIPGINIEDSLLPEVLLTIWNHYTLINPFGPGEPKDLFLFNEMTRRLKGNHGELRSTGSGVDVIGSGDAVQVLVNDETKDACVITPCTSNDGVIAMYCVFCLIDDGEYGIVMGVLKCETEDNVMKVGRELNPEAIQLLPANEQVRRVGIVHACHKESSIEGSACTVRVAERDVIHNLSLMKGGS